MQKIDREETLHDDIEAHADNIYEDWIGEL